MVEISDDEYRELLYCKKILYEALTSYCASVIATEKIIETVKHQAELIKSTKNLGETCPGTEGKIL